VIFTKLFSRRWWWVTLIVLLGMVILARLGLWQLDRRTEKLALNQAMAQRWKLPAFDLNQETLPADLRELAFRHIQATGSFDYAHQIIVKNDVRNDVPGVNLITPLVLADDPSKAVLVARGWIPLEQAVPEQWAQFDEPTSSQPVIGLLRESQVLEGALAPSAPQQEWWRVDIAAIQTQMPYTLLPAFIEQLPAAGRAADALPMRAAEPAPYDELMHSSYAVQWFSFSLIFGFIYLQVVLREERKAQQPATTPAEADTHQLDAPASSLL
jgi:surfeit locus 1 family protein